MDTSIVLEELIGDVYTPKTIHLKLDEDFNIDDTNIDGELCKASRLMVYYGNLAAELEAQASRYKDKVEQLYSELDIRTRDTQGKLTEGKIKAIIVTNDRYMELRTRYISSYMYQTKVENFFKSQQRKVDCMIALAYKQRAEINKGML